MLFQEKGVNWNDTPTRYKRGVAFYKVSHLMKNVNPKDPEQEVERLKWVKDYEMPIITQNRAYVENWVDASPMYPTYNPKMGHVLCEDIDLSRVFVSSMANMDRLDENMKNFAKDIVSEPIDTDELREQADNL
jgi:hypothetical protein